MSISTRWATRVATAVAGSAMLLLSAPAAQAASAEQITAYDVRLDLRADGSLTVTETIRYDFGGADRHGIIRAIPVRFHLDATRDRITPVSSIAATADAAPVRFDAHVGGDTQYIRVGNPDLLVHGVHTYVIRYTVRGATNAVAGRTELDWNAVGDDWTVPIMGLTVTATAPAPLRRADCVSGEPGRRVGCVGSAVDGSVATFRQDGLCAGTDLTVALAVPAGSMAASPLVVRRHDMAAAMRVTPATEAAGLRIAGMGVLAVLVALRTTRRLRPIGPASEPPAGIRPGQAGALLHAGVSTAEVTATIVDLAVRGHLRIRELTRAEPVDWELVRLDGPPDGLAAYERTLLRALFSERDRVRLSELRGGSDRDLTRVRRLLDADVVAQGWYAGSPDRARRRLRWTAAGLLAVALAVTVALGLAVQAAPLGAGAVVPCLLLLVLAHRMVPPTESGRVMLARVTAFRRHLRTSAPAGGQPTRYLPYAMVFGLADRWVGRLASLGDAAEETGMIDGAGGLPANWCGKAGACVERSFLGFNAAAASAMVRVATRGGSSTSGAGADTAGGGSWPSSDTSGLGGGGMGGGGGGSW